MSRAELLAHIGRLKSRHATRFRAQQMKAAAAVLDREARLRAILETAVEGIITIDERGIIESANLAAEKIFGYKQQELAGKNVSILMPSPDRQRHDGYISNYRHTGHAKIIGIGREVAGRRKDGTVFPMDLSVSEVKLPGRRLFTGFIRDISSRKEAEKVLSHYAALVESSDDAIIGKTLAGRITSWNAGAEKIFGFKSSEAVGESISIIIPPDRLGEESMILEKIRLGEPVEHFETVRRRKDGRLVDISVTISPIREPGGKIIGASKVARDITGRKRLEKEILEISEREQRRIGYDLHDGLCQQLAGIELMSQVLEQKLSRESPAFAGKVGDIAKGVREAIVHTRSLARGLSPVTLESEGLAAALRELAVNTQKIFNVACHFQCDGSVPVHDHAAASNLFRIAQESVSNAIKHGKAKRVVISLELRGGKIWLRVRDNGGGLPKNFAAQKTSGMGLRIMKSRAGMIGGTVSIEPDSGRGLTVVCSVPCQPPVAESKKTDARKTKTRHQARPHRR